MQKFQRRLLVIMLAMALISPISFNIFSQPEQIPVTPLDHYINETIENENLSTFPASFISNTQETTFLRFRSEASKARILSGQPNLKVDDTTISAPSATMDIEDTIYVAIEAILPTLYPNASVTYDTHMCAVFDDNLDLKAYVGNPYITVNGRYLYVPEEVKLNNGYVMVPLHTLTKALGTTTQWDPITETLLIEAVNEPLTPGSQYYNQKDLYWLSRIINAESRNQPLSGKIAVGTVILNRVESSKFPNSVYDVIFSGIQFSPVSNGSIYLAPSQESIIAAKLTLDGAKEAENSLFFHQKNLNSWAARTKTFVTTIADHDFYQ